MVRTFVSGRTGRCTVVVTTFVFHDPYIFFLFIFSLHTGERVPRTHCFADKDVRNVKTRHDPYLVRVYYQGVLCGYHAPGTNTPTHIVETPMPFEKPPVEALLGELGRLSCMSGSRHRAFSSK